MSSPETVTGAPLVTLTIQLRADTSDEEVVAQVRAAWALAKPLPAPAVEQAAEEAEVEVEELPPGIGVMPSTEVGMPGIRVDLPE